MHDPVIEYSFRKIDGDLVAEGPLWYKYGHTNRHVFTGHVDLLVARDGTMWICDYKPGEHFLKDTSALSRHFFQDIAQIAAYAVIIRRWLGPNVPIKCIIYNKKAAWTFQPAILSTYDRVLLEMVGNDRSVFEEKAIWRPVLLQNYHLLPDYNAPPYREEEAE